MNYQKLKKYREEKNLTQEKMARQLGIAHSGYVCVENGYKEPSLSVLKRMSEITGYSFDSLINETDVNETPMPSDELEAYKAISFNLVKTLCVAPEARRLGRSERDIDDLALKKLKLMLKSLSGKEKREYERAVNMRRERGGFDAGI